MFVTMLSGSVNLLFLSLTGTSGYSSSVGSARSHAQSYFASTAVSFSSSGAVSQPRIHTTLSVPTRRSSASARPSRTLARSMQSLNASRCGAKAAMSASACSRLRMTSAICCCAVSMFCLAVPGVPPRFASVKPKVRSAASASVSSSFMQMSST